MLSFSADIIIFISFGVDPDPLDRGPDLDRGEVWSDFITFYVWGSFFADIIIITEESGFY